MDLRAPFSNELKFHRCQQCYLYDKLHQEEGIDSDEDFLKALRTSETAVAPRHVTEISGRKPTA
jgi:hypothetical protein